MLGFASNKNWERELLLHSNTKMELMGQLKRTERKLNWKYVLPRVARIRDWPELGHSTLPIGLLSL